MRNLIPQRFALIRTLREDRYSKTFLANDHLQDRENVIVKIKRKDCVQADTDRLVEHFSWLIGVQHRQFATVWDAGLTRQRNLYCVREYLPASELSSADPLTLTKSLVAAVDFLSRHGRVHGAMKPSNVFVSKEGVKIADANVLGPTSSYDEESVHFTAPEILRGGQVDHEGDLYSLGALLYYIFTCRHLFEDPDLNRLKSKYLSAYPQPPTYLSPVLQPILRLVLELLSRNRARRPIAFESLKQIIAPTSVVADRAAFVGRAGLLREASETILQGTNRLRVLLLEGVSGVGKSRFVSELRLRCSVHGLNFVVWRCTQTSNDVSWIIEGLSKLLRTSRDLIQTGSKFDFERFTSDINECLAASVPSVERKYPQEKIISDLAGIVSVLARRIRLVLAIEDIDSADAKTMMLLEQLAFRASEIPLTLLLTRQTTEVEPKWTETMVACLGPELIRLRLPRLSDEESQRLVQFLEGDRERQPHVLRLSKGHPLFIENYSKETKASDSIPTVVEETANSMLSKVTKSSRTMLQTLSMFQKPVPISILASLCEREVLDLESDLNVASRVGLAERSENGFQIPYPAVQMKLYSEIPKHTKQRLHATAFAMLKQVEYEPELLAHHAFEGGMATEACTIYRDLARDAHRASEFRVAQLNYERARKCGLTDQILVPMDTFKLARCYQWSGKQKHARRVFEELLSMEFVQRDPELLSAAYSGLATVFERTKAKTRVDFQELAIRCLPKDSPTLCLRYGQLAELLVRTGDLPGAEQAVIQADRCMLRRGTHVAEPNVYRSTLFMNTGRFKEAVQSMMSYTAPESETVRINPNALLNNLAFCYENLGDLRAANEHQLKILKSSITSGTVSGHILSLGNLASIKTKLGEMLDAEQLFIEAFEAIARLRKRSDGFNRERFITVAYDAVSHALHRGEYRRASELLRKTPLTLGFIFELDRMFCHLVRCKFFVETGLTNKVRDLFRRFAHLSIFNIDYFRVERSLLEARMPDIPAKSRIEGLEHALTLSEKLGTLYQGCEVLISLAAVHLELDENQNAQDCVKKALKVANGNGYRILAARALLLLGRASDKITDKQHFLTDAYQLASEMGLQELGAEAAYRIGIANLESGNVATAREYLIRSTSITARVADGVPVAARPGYLAKEWRRDAVRALERCNGSIPLHASTMINTVSDKYFNAVYRFTMAATAADSINVLLAAIEKTLFAELSRSAVITLKVASRSTSIPIRTKLSPEWTQRVELIRNHAKNRLFFESVDERGKLASAWIPMNSETCEGGIYVACRLHELHFSEKEIEFLTMMGAIASSALKRLETGQARETESLELSEFQGIIGTSKPIRDVYSEIKMAAGNVATVLIEGESGTGKELVAKAIHNSGPRAKEPFIAVDCGAIPEGLIEAELFGSKKGSYTGAVADRPGLFEAAHRGTIFLDEISNTTAALQAKLLRVIQEREVRRIGETKGRVIDVRLIVASNQRLEALAEAGGFRKDLLYRLKVLHIKVPPLRERRDDIPMLAYAFLQKLNTSQKAKKHFASGVVERLSMQKFPGNVRELQNAVERAFFLAKGIMITEVPVEASTSPSRMPADEIETWYKDISEGRKDFWSAVHNRYKRRDISREKVVALVDFGLRSTRGSYKNMASVFRLKEREYRRFMDFLRRNECLLDFRPYRKAATASREN